MDNKIKITVSILLSFLFSSCIAWFDNDILYKRTLNEWSSIQYSIESSIYQGDDVRFSFSNNLNKDIGKRTEISDNGYFFREPIINHCSKIIYNNDYILAEKKRIPNPIDSAYYKLTPTFAEDKITPNGYNIDTISKANFDALVNECTDCQELDADKIRAMDYELDHGGFPTKTVVFLLLIVAYILYRINYKKS